MVNLQGFTVVKINGVKKTIKKRQDLQDLTEKPLSAFETKEPNDNE